VKSHNSMMMTMRSSPCTPCHCLLTTAAPRMSRFLSYGCRVVFLPAETCFCRTCGLNQFKPEKTWLEAGIVPIRIFRKLPECRIQYSVDILSLVGSLLYSSVRDSLYK